jgi:hypothetical protein
MEPVGVCDLIYHRCLHIFTGNKKVYERQPVHMVNVVFGVRAYFSRSTESAERMPAAEKAMPKNQ